jgi:hypothetical protein
MKKTMLAIAVTCLMGMVYGQENRSPKADANKESSIDTSDVESFEEVLVSSQRFATN